MKIKRIKFQCSAIVQPGEFVIDLWDNKQCSLTDVTQLANCDHCGQWFCFMFHYHKHIDLVRTEESARTAGKWSDQLGDTK